MRTRLYAVPGTVNGSYTVGPHSAVLADSSMESVRFLFPLRPAFLFQRSVKRGFPLASTQDPEYPPTLSLRRSVSVALAEASAYRMTRGMWPDSLLRDLEPVESRTISNGSTRLRWSNARGLSITNMRVRSVNASLALSSTTKDVSWSTTEEPLTLEEEDAIVTLVVVVVGIIVAIVVLFSMGIFIDCKHQKKDALIKKKKLKLRMPPISRIKRSKTDDVKSLAAGMCPTGASDSGYRTSAIV
ncbi:uncharacterized protein LOC128874650 isoform X1 [Hylaeus volcanicus]|uniref:uncharacterized protein LOC128874650 isoform X1 n=1 Tax=Hylaeus volcanicus TaxID=313075 RepID=UPI0023B7CD63|nr:uncharacterized protein LOC128874650 isoform X1 [Hylaeus volcanicus]